MKTFKKSLLTLFATITMVVICCFGVSALIYYTSGYYEYTRNNKEATIINVNSSIRGNVIIPSNFGEYKVTGIDDAAFGYCTNIEKITISSNIENIGICPFMCCENLQSITVAAANVNYSNDEYGVLFNIDKTNLVQYPSGNTETAYTIPEGVTSIEQHAFDRCRNLISVTIPDSVTELGEYVFAYCDNLENITIGKGITVISPGAFKQCYGLTNLKIPDTVTSVDECAFQYCDNLESITIGKNVLSIGRYAFESCDNLTDVYYYGVKEQWEQINIADNNESLTEATIHFLGENVESGSNIYDKNNDGQKIKITPKTEKKETDLINSKTYFKNVSGVTVKSAAGEEIIDGSFTVKRGVVEQQDIVLIHDDYYNYVIPKDVVASWSTENKTTYKFDAYLRKAPGDAKPYISSAFARTSGSEKPYKDIVVGELEAEKNKKYDIILTSRNALPNSTYYLSQDNSHRLLSSDGVFSSKEIANEFQQGRDIYAYIISGTQTSEPLKLNIDITATLPENIKNTLDSATINILGENSGIKIPKNIPLLGGTTIKTDCFQFPVGVEITGSKIRISLGFDIFRKETTQTGNKVVTESEWIDFKKEMKEISVDLKSKKNAWKEYNKIRKKKGEKGLSTRKNSFNVGVLGYIELDATDDGITVTDSFASIFGEYKFSATAQFQWVYVHAEAGAEIGFEVQNVQVIPDDNVPFQFNATLKFNPKLKASAGAGAKKVASIGIYGKGYTPFENNFATKYRSFSINGEFGVEADLIIWDVEIPIIDKKHKIYEGYYGKSKRVSDNFVKYQLEPYENTQVASVSVSSRDYAEESTEWLGEYNTATYSLADKGVSFDVLQTGVFGQSEPQLISFSDKLLMAWVEDDQSRDTYNRMRLVYSVYNPENNTWSEPKAVHDDGHNDVSPRLATDGNTVYIVWQKVDETLTKDNTDTFDVFFENSEVFTAEYNEKNDCFENIIQLTDNKAYDYATDIESYDEQVFVYYARNNDNNVNGKNNNDIYCHEIKGKAEKIAENKNYILSVAANVSEEGSSVSYITDTDGDAETTEDIDVYTSEGTGVVRFPKEQDGTAYSVALYGKLEGERTLFVSDMSNIYYQQNGERLSIFENDRTIESNIVIVESVAGPSFIWTESNEENGNELWSVSYENSTWTKPVQISDIGSFKLYDVGAVILDGKLVGICNMTEITTDNETGEYSEGFVNLCSFTANDFTDISLDIDIIREADIIPGKTSDIGVYVENKGTTDIGEIDFVISDTLGTNTTVTKNIDIKSGATEFITIGYPVPENYALTTLTVTASIPGTTESDTKDNSESAEIGKSDLSVMQTELINIGDNYILKAVVENNSAVDAEGVVVSAVFNDSEEEPFEQCEIGVLAKEQYVDYELAFNKDLVEFDENGVGKLYLKVTSSSNESADGDNQICVAVTLPQETECAHPLTEKVEGEKPTCTVSGYSEYEGCSACGEKVGYEEIPAINHKNATEHTQQDATCTEIGYTAGKHCPDCKTWIEGHEEIPVIPHTYRLVTTPATLTANGKAEYKCSCGDVQKTETIAKIKSLTLSATSYIYDGKNKTPKLTVKDANGKTLVKNTDYKITVASKRAGIGRYTVKVTFMGNYSGSKSLYFYILPGKPATVKSVSQGTTSNKLTWSAVPGAVGYTLYYYSNSKKAYKKINTTTNTSYTVKGLLTGTKYTFKIVAYGETASGKVYDSETYALLKSATKTKTPELTKVTASSTKGKAYVYHTNVKGETGYTVYYSTNKTTGFKKYANFKADTTRCDITKLTSGKTYYFKVRTYIKTDSGYVYSPWSNIKGVKVK